MSSKNTVLAGSNRKRKRSPTTKRRFADGDIETDVIDNLDHIAALGYQILKDGHKVDEWLDKFSQSCGPVSRPSPEDVSTYHRKPENTLPQQQEQHGKLALHEEDRLVYSNMKNVEYIKHTEKSVAQCIEKGKALSLFQWPVDHGKIEERIIKDDDRKTRSASTSFAFISTKGAYTDEKWDQLYGDGIDEEEFRCRCISQETKQHSSSNNWHGLDAFISNTDDHSDNGHDCDKPNEMKQALKEFIQRCWERSLHIASNTFNVNCMDSFGDSAGESQKANAGNSPLDESNTTEIIHDKTDGESIREKSEYDSPSNLSHQAQAVLKCKELGIVFDHICVDSDSWYICQSCHQRLRYDSNEQVMNHLFGTQTSKGCCWEMIQEKRRMLAESVLQREAMSIIDNILQVVLKSKQSFNTDKDASTRNENVDPLNWKCVCITMLESLRNAVVFADNEEKMSPLQTIQLDPDLPPFPMNGAIMEIALSRLIDRYIQ